MSLAILAKKTYAQRGLSHGTAFRTGVSTTNASSRLAYRVERLPDVWKPVQDQNESTYLHKKVVKYASCWPSQTPSEPAECTNGNARTTYKDMRTQSAGEYISIFETNKTCYQNEPAPQNNTCS